MNPSTETWLISTISKRLERIAEGKEPMAEDRALTLLSILKDVAGDIPSLTNLPQHVKEWLEAAINARLDAIAEKREIAAEDRIATLTEALAALRPPASPGGSVERVDTGVGLSGGPITTTGTISLSTSSQQAIARANTSVQPEDLADVATSGNYADLTNTPDIPEQFNPIQGANMLITGTYPNITFSAVAGEEFTPVWGEIQGTLADQTDLQDALDGKAPTVHTHTWADVSGKPATATRWPTWNEVTGKPTIPAGTVTSVSAGDGMSFSTITGSGEVTLGYPAQVHPTSVSEVTSGGHSHSFTSLFSDTTDFTADHAPDQYPSSVVSLSRVGTLADTGWPSNGLAANFMSYGNRYGQLYFETNNNKLFFRTSNSNTSWTGDFEEVYHTGNLPSADTGDVPNTIMRRDSQGDAHARLFRSTFPSQSDLSSNASIAFRINDSDQNYIRFTNSPSALRSWLGLGSAAASNISDFASSSRFTYVGSVSGGSYYDYFPGGNAVSYFFHAAGNSPSDAPASPARQTAVLGMDTSWGTTQLAITNEDTPQVFVRANGVTSWNRVWTAADFDPSSKFDNPSGSTNQYIRGNGSLATFPSIPTSSNYVATSGNQSGLSGNKTWTGNHTFATVSDSIGNVRKPEYRTANGTITLNSNDVNRIVEKSNNSSYTYTIPSGHGSHGDIITFVNSGTSGNLTIDRASGVSLYRNGTNANITVGPGSTVTIYRSATANRWIA